MGVLYGKFVRGMEHYLEQKVKAINKSEDFKDLYRLRQDSVFVGRGEILYESSTGEYYNITIISFVTRKIYRISVSKCDIIIEEFPKREG